MSQNRVVNLSEMAHSGNEDVKKATPAVKQYFGFLHNNSEVLVSHTSCSWTPFSNHYMVEIYWFHNPCNLIPSIPPEISSSGFKDSDFLIKADTSRLDKMIRSVEWNLLWELC